MTVSPEEKHRLLVGQWGIEEVKKRITELKAKGQAQSTLRAVDILYQDAQWESVETNVVLQGFYLGNWRRGPTGLEQDETYVLTRDGPERLWADSLEFLQPITSLNGKGCLAPIEISGVSKVENIGTHEKRIRVANGASLRRTNLPPQLLVEWANKLDEIESKPKAAFVVEAISAVRDTVPPEGWVAVEGGRRQRVQEVKPLPVVDSEGAINLRLQLGGDAGRVSVKISSGEDLLNLLNVPDDTEDTQAWWNWIEENAIRKHDEVLKEIQSLAGRQVVVFGSGGGEITRRDKETGKQETIPTGSPFITTNQMGFLMSFNNATKRIQELAQGQETAVAKPSAATTTTPTAAAAAVTKKAARDAILDLVDAGQATKEAVKKLAGKYDANELVDAALGLESDGIAKYDSTVKQYVRIKPKEG